MIEGSVESFAALDDPRRPGEVERLGRSGASPLPVDVPVIAVRALGIGLGRRTPFGVHPFGTDRRAVVAEAETFEDIAPYGRGEEGWPRGFVGPPGGVPSHDTFRRVAMPVDPDAFERCSLAWVREAFRREPGDEPLSMATR